MKEMSAMGRLVRLNIALEHINDPLLFGTGIGRFTWYYPQWQAQYFSLHTDLPKTYFLNAGESFIIFNEYVQLFETIGVCGFLLFTALVSGFFYTQSGIDKYLLNTIKLTALAILACGVTSYPLHVNIFLLLLVFCFAAAVKINARSFFKLPNLFKGRFPATEITGKVAFTLIAGCVMYTTFQQWTAKKEFEDLKGNLTISRNEAAMEYARLKSSLRYNGKFLTEYGRFLMQDSSVKYQAVLVLEEAKQYFISKTTIEWLGQAYKQTGDHQKAIENYEWLCHYLPNQFSTKATVVAINPYIDENGMALVKLKPLEKSALIPGMNCSAIIKIIAGRSLIVPREAIVMRSDRPVVFTSLNNRAQWNYVTVGRTNGKEVEILSGIKPGQKVILSNNLQLAHDSPIKEIMKEGEENNNNQASN